MDRDNVTTVDFTVPRKPKPTYEDALHPVAMRHGAGEGEECIALDPKPLFLKTPRKLADVLPRWIFDVDGEMRSVTCNSMRGAARSLMVRFPKAKHIALIGTAA